MIFTRELNGNFEKFNILLGHDLPLPTPFLCYVYLCSGKSGVNF